MNSKKLAALVGLAVTLALAIPVKAAQPWAANNANSLYEVGASTPALTPFVISAGAGQFNGASISSAVAGAYCVFFDSASTSGITSATQDGTNAAPKVAYAWLTTVQTIAPAVPASAPFRNGLIGICNAVARLIVLGSRNQ
jgi:hypothetical protein